MVESLKAPERIDLFEYMQNKGVIPSEQSYGWCAGDQLQALRFHLSPAVEILSSAMVGSYQGECFAIMKVEAKYIIWRDGFGSCSGCDGLEGSDGFQYIKSTLSEGNTKQFSSLSDIEEFISNEQNNKSWSEWSDFPSSIIEKAKESIL